MTGVAEDIADRIVALGFGQVTSPVNVFTGEMPSLPDNAIAVREMAGQSPVRAMGASGSSPKMDRPDVQVIVRRTTYSALVLAVTGIKAGLDWWKGTIDGKEYYLVELAYEPVYLGRDENNRRQTSLVFHIHKQR